MLKLFFFFISPVLIINSAKCQGTDTAIFYYKYDLRGYHKVGTLDSCDFFRITLPPDSSDNRVFNVKEFYKNGKIKFLGKFIPQSSPRFPLNSLRLSGDCISFYPNGKKQDIAHYTDGNKEGNEYLFYPNGSVYCLIKNSIEHGTFNTSAYWECYDANGTMICSEGNGKWIVYDKGFKEVLISGQVKNGLKEGEWHGRTGEADSIKFLYTYHKDIITSSFGYDKTGTAYPFKQFKEMATYKGGPITFIEVFKGHLNLPKDRDRKKMPVDTIHISFIIERDGQVTGFKTLGNVNAELNNALADAMAKCRDWAPSRYYGIPLRTEIVIPLDFRHGYTADRMPVYRKEVNFNFRIIGF